MPNTELRERQRQAALLGPGAVVVTITLAPLGGGETARDIAISHSVHVEPDHDWLARELHRIGVAVSLLDGGEPDPEELDDDPVVPDNVRVYPGRS